MVIKFMKVFV